jgi:hypothetical protein
MPTDDGRSRDARVVRGGNLVMTSTTAPRWRPARTDIPQPDEVRAPRHRDTGVTVPTPDAWRHLLGPTMPPAGTKRTVCKTFDIPARTVDDWVLDRKFPTIRAGRTVLVPLAGFLAFLEQVPARVGR